MTYQEIRSKATTGDVVGVQGTGLFSRAIRFFTQESFSHVAMFVWHGTGLWIYEFVEGRGFQCMPASQWFMLRQKQKLFVGKAPTVVRKDPELVKELAGSFRASRIKQHYGIISLFKILVSQWTKKEIPTFFKNCSTYIQYVWEKAGYEIQITSDPGDIMKIAAMYGAIKEVQFEP